MDRIGKTVNAPRRLVAWVCLFLMLGPMGAACGQKSPEVERKGYTVRFDCRGGEPEIPPRVVYGPFGSPAGHPYLLAAGASRVLNRPCVRKDCTSLRRPGPRKGDVSVIQ